MPQIDNVSVTNTNTGVIWVTGQQATGPNVPFPAVYHVYVNAAVNNQPPAGFFNNPAHQFVIQGRYLADGSAFVSGLLAINAGLSDPPLVYVF
jgi:hypothetical protein